MNDIFDSVYNDLACFFDWFCNTAVPYCRELLRELLALLDDLRPAVNAWNDLRGARPT